MSLPPELLTTHTLTDLADTEKLAKLLARTISSSDVLALSGDLGAGKTCLARYLITALGHNGDVPSPTFTLVQRYDLPDIVVHHFDLYRLKSPDELDEIGWYDALAEGVVIVEWPDKAGRHLPPSAIHITLDIQNDTRRCTIAIAR